MLAVAAIALLDVVLVFLLFRGDDGSSVPAPEGATDVQSPSAAEQTPERSKEPTPTKSAQSPGESPAASPSGSASPSPRESASRSPTPSPVDEPETAPLSLSLPRAPAAPATPVPVRGRYTDAEPGTRLVLERRRGNDWVPFPLPTATRADGDFRTFVALTEPGSYRLRIRDPEAGVTSKVSVLRIR